MSWSGPVELGAFSLLRPAWLLALLVLPWLAWRLQRRERDRNPWNAVVDAHLLPFLLAPGAGRRARLRVPAIVGACALAIVALAGPSWRSVPEVLAQGRAPLLIAVDLSSATATPDLSPTRLVQARTKIAALLAAHTDGETGLVAFADDAFTVAPLTPDTANVALFIDALSPDIMPVDGSRADRAIAWSARLLKQAGHVRGDILLLTDHADAAAASAASRAAAGGFRVSVLGMGTTAGAAFRRDDGSIATARLRPAGLRAVASAGGGSYIASTVDQRDVDAFTPLLGDPAREGGRVTLRTHEDGGYWLLLPLLLLAAAAFRRNAGVLVLVAGLGLPLVSMPAPAFAQRAASAAADAEAESTTTSNAAAPVGSAWQRADQRAHARMQQGISAYRAKDYAGALRAWDGLPSADAAYNRGNAHAEAGNYADAIAAYDDALRKAPGMQDAIRNRAVVQAAMERPPPPQGPRQDRQGPSQRSDGGGEAGRESRPADDAKPGEEAGESSKAPTTPSKRAPAPGTQQPESRDAPLPPAAGSEDTQRRADAAQRERMRAALARGAPDDTGDSEGEAAGERAGESREDSERRASGDAWLRRVPDDPGGLLRLRFRIEHERRQQRGVLP